MYVFYLQKILQIIRISTLTFSVRKFQNYTPSLASPLNSHHDFSRSINSAPGTSTSQQHLGSQIPDASGISSKEQPHQSHSRKCHSADIQMGEK
jgi:hypothetical protein